MLSAALILFFFQAAGKLTWQEHNRLGEEAFRAGKLEESIKRFDQAIALEPRLAPQHWQRGISLYYAGRYDDCRRQFEIHKTVNPEDVENSVFHYLCVARLKSPAEARKSLIEIHSDTRVPMMEVYAMYRGESTPAKVLATAGRDRNALFYAHLYIALFHDANRRPADVAHHLRLCVEDFEADHYMGDVARVHWRLVNKK
jgi:lipoprotein NlpI